jgi:hypothetical protein
VVLSPRSTADLKGWLLRTAGRSQWESAVGQSDDPTFNSAAVLGWSRWPLRFVFRSC